MSWFSDLVDVVINTAEGVVSAGVAVSIAPLTVIEAVIRNNPEKVNEELADLKSSITNYADAKTDILNLQNMLLIDVSNQIGGDGAKVISGVLSHEIIANRIPSNIIKSVLDITSDDPEEIAKALLSAPLSSVLAAALQSARDQLRGKGGSADVTRPVPLSIKAIMADKFPEGLVESTRYSVSRFGVSLPEAINGFQAFMGNHSHAVAVGDTIVFSNEPGVDEAIYWWAHELTHVKQYSEMGYLGFAKAYIENYRALEEEADDVAKKIFRDFTGVPFFPYGVQKMTLVGTLPEFK